jgi:hypothetical protein
VEQVPFDLGLRSLPWRPSAMCTLFFAGFMERMVSFIYYYTYLHCYIFCIYLLKCLFCIYACYAVLPCLIPSTYIETYLCLEGPSFHPLPVYMVFPG